MTHLLSWAITLITACLFWNMDGAKPRRLNGSNTLGNLITLCEKCHQKTEGKEELYMEKYFSFIKSSDDKNLNDAQHVMIGKKWLREQLSSSDTASYMVYNHRSIL